MANLKRTALLLATTALAGCHDHTRRIYPTDRDFDNIVQTTVMHQKEIFGIEQKGEPRVKRKLFLSVDGNYSPCEDTISILAHIVDPEKIVRVVSHELGHRYTSQLIAPLNKGKGLCDTLRFGKSPEHVGADFILEGIAEYLSIKNGKPRRDSSHVDYRNPGDVYDNPAGYYHTALNVVKPVLNLGIDKGIETLIKFPPTESDMDNLLAYRRRIVAKLREEGK